MARIMRRSWLTAGKIVHRTARHVAGSESVLDSRGSLPLSERIEGL